MARKYYVFSRNALNKLEWVETTEENYDAANNRRESCVSFDPQDLNTLHIYFNSINSLDKLFKMLGYIEAASVTAVARAAAAQRGGG